MVLFDYYSGSFKVGLGMKMEMGDGDRQKAINQAHNFCFTCTVGRNLAAIHSNSFTARNSIFSQFTSLSITPQPCHQLLLRSHVCTTPMA
jgi:hypothetical protein